ncbi:alanyl-tRNA synthetase [Neorickettsia risticii str. Illinois]|uniref:Alanine--tRNA ligase n=1 Tax=Neorickettsia risticii (strain Illinois) TaxID=434131 RepID=C6V432_NEORI|nr:alanine--tRNA ligase [Neorickettsia risticii]ACT69148.1 alanyl-tRNA synthetase [Neorickettsia risticii str. Illinois]
MIDGLRKKFIDFFVKNGHTHLPSASLVPKDDPSLMFVNAGMVPFKEYFADVKKAPFSSIVTAQKCVRAGGKHNDLENVGFTKRHHTFFEMLGNFSFGCYFKERAIELAWKFVTEELKLSKEKLYITVYHEDDEAFEIWDKLTGFGERKIKRISTSDNFWQMGDIGPCGPCSEIFYDHGEHLSGDIPEDNKDPGERCVEIWNLVFMQYIRKQSGELARMECPCIDTGMGLERVAAILEGTDDNYKTKLFEAIVKESQKVTGNKDNQAAHKVIADHLRSASFLIADGVLPGNTGREYVLRRIIRRAVRYSHVLGFDTVLLPKLFWVLEECMGSYYQELTRAKNLILDTLTLEEESFRNTLKSGMKLLEEVSSSMKGGDTLSGDIAFTLYDTHGFPLDITIDVLKEKKISVDEERFAERMKMQRLLAQASRMNDTAQTSSYEVKAVFLEHGKTPFIGYENFTGLALILAITEKEGSNELTIILDQTIFYPESGGQESDQGIIEGENTTLKVEKVYKSTEGVILHECKIIKGQAISRGEKVNLKIDINRRNSLARNHSATHVLHHVLRKRLGTHVSQRGSLVTPNRLRFDFSHSQPITEEELSKIEDCINLMIWDDHPVITEVKKTDDAIRDGAIGLFGEKYDDTVRVVSIGEAVELCGGTHVKKSSSIGLVKILSASSVAHGVRRIEAVTHLTALQYMREEIQAQLYQLNEHQSKLKTMQKSHQKEITSVYQSIVANAEAQTERYGSVEIVTKNVQGISREILLSLASGIRPRTGVLIIHTELSEALYLLIILDKEICKNISFIDSMKERIGKSHGKVTPSVPYVIQATFPEKEDLDRCLKNLSKLVASTF